MTTDWSKQSAEMSQAWLEGQRAAWEQWSRAATAVGVPPAAGGGAAAPGVAWERMLAAWRESVEGALALQAGWIERWNETGATIEGPEATAEWAKQGSAMMTEWLDAQRQLWSAYFDAAASMGPARPATPTEAFTGAWQDAATRMADMQAQWMQSWGGPTSKGAASSDSSGSGA